MNYTKYQDSLRVVDVLTDDIEIAANTFLENFVRLALEKKYSSVSSWWRGYSFHLQGSSSESLHFRYDEHTYMYLPAKLIGATDDGAKCNGFH